MDNKEARNWDFFDRRSQKTNLNSQIETKQSSNLSPDTSTDGKLKTEKKISPLNTFKQEDPVFGIISEVRNILNDLEFKALLAEIQKIENGLLNSKFKITVVGEFSRGKSTFINNLFEMEFLPTGNLPTTSVLTKITYNEKEMIVFIDSKGNKNPMPLSLRYWKEITAKAGEPDLNGVAFVGINSEWLAETGIEIIDTPGIGDTDKRRAMLVNDALLCGDGAIIVISAHNALSMTEREFIEQKLITSKVPYMMLVLTHLDNIKPKERSKIIEYVMQKLQLWRINIPVFVMQNDIDIPGMDCSGFIGILNIKSEINKWVYDEHRMELKRLNVYAQALKLLDIAESSVSEKLQILQFDDEERAELVKQKKLQISKIELYCEELNLEMLKRGNDCYKWMNSVVMEKSEMIIERLQYEAEHTNDPAKWWERDYPYKLKVELMNLAVSLESSLNQRCTNDLHWLNLMLEKQFKTTLNVNKDTPIADKDEFKEVRSTKDIEFEDLNRKKILARIGTGTVTIAGFVLFSATGMLPIAATIGIGTGSALISERFFKGKIEEQQKIIREAIASDIPKVIDSALISVEKKLNKLYSGMAKEVSVKGQMWINTQVEALDSGETKTILAQSERIKQSLTDIKNLINKIEKISEV